MYENYWESDEEREAAELAEIVRDNVCFIIFNVIFKC